MVEVTELPNEVGRYLARADELIDIAVMNNLDVTNADHMKACNDAVCAQIELWMQLNGDGIAIYGPLQNVTSGDVLMRFDSNMQNGKLSLRAAQYLNSQGLLYRGMNNKFKYESGVNI
jgi:hypothetical protein